MKMENNCPDSVGFFCGLLIGMVLPLMLLGGELSAGKNLKIRESFYGGIVSGILLDIAVIVGLIFLFGH